MSLAHGTGTRPAATGDASRARRPRAITARQRQILEIITLYHAVNGYPPSIRDVCRIAGLGLSTVFQHILALERKGYVARPHRRLARAISVLRPPRDAAAPAAAGGRPGRDSDSAEDAP